MSGSGTRFLKKFEDFGYILDHLPQGKIEIGKYFRAEPIVQIIGENYFTLLEGVAKKNALFQPHERLYIGKDAPRDKIDHIIGRIDYEKLTTNSKNDLSIVIDEIVKRNEPRFVNFFNISNSITPRMHSLELLPGIGKKYTLKIIEMREKKKFQDFQDIKERTEIPDPPKLISKRIIEELSEKVKYNIFTR